MSNNNVPAIYCIKNIINEKIYIGSSVCVISRWSGHRRSLTKGTHCNIKLQRAWNKHGSETFDFQIIHTVEHQHELLVWEQFWIDRLKPYYNIIKIAGSPLGLIHSKEAKFKMAERKRKLHIFQSPEGKLMEIYDLKAFCLENDLNQGHMAGVHNGRKYQYKGWTLPNPGPAPIKSNEKGFKFSEEAAAAKIANRVKTYTFVSPDNKVVTFTNINKFGRDNNLNPSLLVRVSKGKSSHHKGWTLPKINSVESVE